MAVQIAINAVDQGVEDLQDAPLQLLALRRCRLKQQRSEQQQQRDRDRETKKPKVGERRIRRGTPGNPRLSTHRLPIKLRAYRKTPCNSDHSLGHNLKLRPITPSYYLTPRKDIFSEYWPAQDFVRHPT